MSGKAFGWARDVICSGGFAAKAVLLLMADFADGDDELFPSVARMARELQAAERTVQRAITTLVEDGIIAREFRTTKTGKKTSSCYRLLIDGAAERCQKVTSSPVTEAPTEVSESRDVGVTVTPSTTFEPLPEPVSPDGLTPGACEREREREDQVKAAFDRVVALWSAAAPERCSEVRAWPKWTEACDGRDPAHLEHAARRYLTEAGEVKRKLCKALDRWLAEAWFKNWLPGAPPTPGVPAERPVWAGPAAERAAIVAITGEDWAVSYIDPGGWDEAQRAIIPLNSFAADRVRARLRPYFDRLNITVAAQTLAERKPT